MAYEEATVPLPAVTSLSLIPRALASIYTKQTQRHLLAAVFGASPAGAPKPVQAGSQPGEGHEESPAFPPKFSKHLISRQLGEVMFMKNHSIPLYWAGRSFPYQLPKVDSPQLLCVPPGRPWVMSTHPSKLGSMLPPQGRLFRSPCTSLPLPPPLILCTTSFSTLIP